MSAILPKDSERSTKYDQQGDLLACKKVKKKDSVSSYHSFSGSDEKRQDEETVKKTYSCRCHIM